MELKIEDIKQFFDDYETAWNKQRESYTESVKFSRLGEQWPDDIKSIREAEGRPCLTANQIPAFIRQVVNDARQNSPKIKAHPVDDEADKETAEVFNGIIRNIEETSDSGQAYDTGIDNAASGGWGFWRVDIDFASYDSFDQDLSIKRIVNPGSVYPYPHSISADGDDWNGCFITDKITLAEFEQKYPKAKAFDAKGDKDDTWFDGDDVRLAEFWHRYEVDDELLELVVAGETQRVLKSQYDEDVAKLEGNIDGLAQLELVQIVQSRPTKRQIVRQFIVNGKEILEENEWPGRYIPIVMVYGEEVIDEDKKHYLPMWFHARDSQMMFNFWRTAEGEDVAFRPKPSWVGPKGAFVTDKGKWETANTKPWPYLQFDVPTGMSAAEAAPRQNPPAQIAIGAHNAAQNVSNDMRVIMGIYDTALGAQGNEVSGVAIEGRKIESDTSNFHIIDNQVRAINQTGRLLIDLIPFVYNKPRVARILGADGKADEVKINQPLEGGKMFDVTRGRYDLVVKAGPSYTTQRKESFAKLMEMITIDPALAKLIGDLAVQQMDFPMADEISKRLKTMLPPEILAMEKLDGLDDAARGIVANLQKQVKGFEDIIEQGKQMLGAKDQEITMLYQQANDKQRELDIKERDSELKHKASMTDTAMDGLIAVVRENAAQQMEMITNSMAEVRDMAGKTREIQAAVSEVDLLDQMPTE